MVSSLKEFIFTKNSIYILNIFYIILEHRVEMDDNENAGGGFKAALDAAINE